MQAVDKEVIGQILNWLRAGTRCWLATVVETWGSSPRPVGSLLACNSDGVMVGSLSGGCVEDDLQEKLLNGELAPERPQFFQYGVTPEDVEKFGLPCGGHLNIIIEPQTPSAESIAQFDRLNKALGERSWVLRHVDLPNQSVNLIEATKPRALSWSGDQQVLQHTYGPSYQLFMIGAGMVSQYLAEMALMLDYQVTVCDPREDLLEQFPVRNVTKVRDMPDDAVREFANDHATAIVALTHDPRIDDMGLMEALTTEAFYVGAMGSSRTSANRRERLLALDVSEQSLERLHAPIGLPIGSKTPPEIAIAILAEITTVRKSQPAAQAAVTPMAVKNTASRLIRAESPRYWLRHSRRWLQSPLRRRQRTQSLGSLTVAQTTLQTYCTVFSEVRLVLREEDDAQHIAGEQLRQEEFTPCSDTPCASGHGPLSKRGL